MNYSFELKKFLAKKMAEIDSHNMGTTFDAAYEYHLASESFQLFEYWVEYFGVFDNPEDGLINEISPENIFLTNKNL